MKHFIIVLFFIAASFGVSGQAKFKSDKDSAYKYYCQMGTSLSCANIDEYAKYRSACLSTFHNSKDSTRFMVDMLDSLKRFRQKRKRESDGKSL